TPAVVSAATQIACFSVSEDVSPLIPSAINLPQGGPQVLGANLKRSESRGRTACASMMPAQPPILRIHARPPRSITWTFSKVAFILFDHFVGAAEQRKGHSKTEHFRGLEVDNQLNFGGRLVSVR